VYRHVPNHTSTGKLTSLLKEDRNLRIRSYEMYSSYHFNRTSTLPCQTFMVHPAGKSYYTLICGIALTVRLRILETTEWNLQPYNHWL